MEEKQDLEKTENDQQIVQIATNEKSKKIIAVLLIILILIILGLGVYFLFIKKDSNNGTNNGVNNDANNGGTIISNDLVTYKGNDNKEIKLKEIANDPSNLGADPHTYELYEGDNKIIVYGHFKEDQFVVYNDNNFYCLDKTNNKLVASYSSNNKIYYENKNMAGIDWYLIYDNDNLTQIINEKTGLVLSFTKDIPDNVVIYGNKVLLQYENKIIEYNDSGEKKNTYSYDKIINYRDLEIDGDFVVYKDKKLQAIDVHDMSARVLEKEVTYSGDGISIDFYLYLDYEDPDRDSQYIFEYENKYYTTELIDDEDTDDNEYKNIYYDHIEGAAQNYAGSVLVNNKTKKIIDYCQGCGYNIEKVSKGYFFIKIQNRIGDSPYDVSDTKKVLTSKGKELDGYGMYSIVGDNIALQNDDELNVYDVEGNIVKQYKASNLYLIYEKSAFMKIDDKYYIIQLDTYNQKEIEITKDFNLEKAQIYKIEDGKIYYQQNTYDENDEYDYSKSYVYDYINKKVTENKEEDE